MTSPITETVESTPEPEIQKTASSGLPIENPNDAVVKIQDELIKENARKMREMEQEIQKLRSIPSTPEPQQDPQKFFEDPFSNVDSIVKRRMDEALAPLNAIVIKQNRMAAYNKIKIAVKNHPQVKPYWNNIESDLDSLAEQHTGEITLELVGQTIKTLIGNLAVTNPNEYIRIFNSLNNNDSNRSTSTSTPSMSTPPNIPPSAPPLPKEQATNKARELNELERRLAMEKWGNLGQTEAFKKYLEFINESPFVLDTMKKEKK